MKVFFTPAFALIAAILPGAAFANLGPTAVSLSPGQTLSLDTGAICSTGTGDIQFTGSGIAFQGSATGVDLTTASDGVLSGTSEFTTLSGQFGQTTLSGFAGFFRATPISFSASNRNDLIGVTTNGGNPGVVLVNAVSADSLSIQYFTFGSDGGGGCPAVPAISAILNNYGLEPAGFPNSGIAPGTLFIVKGTGLSTSSTFVLQDPAAPGLPTTLNNASVAISSTQTAPAFYYAGSTQLALVMPSNTPPGPATVTVTVNGQMSNVYNINVVPSNFGMLSADQTGSGLVKAVNPNNPANPYIGYTNPAPPGETISIYGSGLGADAARDVEFVQPPAAGAPIDGLAAFYVGGMQVPIQYQGASGYPGLNQVNITLPGNVPTGCYVSIVGVTASGVPTNFLTIPIGTGTCSDTGLGISGSTLSSLSSQTNVRLGFTGLYYASGPATSGSGTQISTAAIAQFRQISGSAYAAGTGSVSIGSCVVTQVIGTSGSGTATSTSTPTPLNAGTITVNSPNAGISPVPLTGNSLVPGFYSASLPSGFLTIAGGTFPIAATAGTTSPAVGAFNTQVAFPAPLLTWTNQAADATVVRSSGVTVNWNGGSPGTYVEISGISTNGTTVGDFLCLAPVIAGSFTVPPYVLAALPQSNSDSTLSVGNYTAPQTFTASGLDYAYTEGYVSYEINAVYQ